MNKPFILLICSLALMLLMTLVVSADTFVGGQVSGVWTTAGSPYYVLADLEIPWGSTLIIEPGVEVKFTSHFKFIVHGSLTAVGTPEDSIRLTHSLPYSDETWAGLSFVNTEGYPEVAFCVLEYGYAQGATSEPYSKGGGINVYNTYVSIHNCRITNNKADDKGAGIFLQQTNSEVFDNVIVNNIAYGDGGGIYIMNCSDPFIHDNWIEDNRADNGGGIAYYYSGGIFQYNSVIHNHADATNGGGIILDHSSPTVSYNKFNTNISVSSNGTGIYCHHFSSPGIAYNEVWDNNHNAIYCGDNCSPVITNNTIHDNDGYAIRTYLNSHPLGRNNIIWQNDYLFYIPSGCSVNMTYSDIQGGYAGTGNINQNPIFVNAYAGNFNLMPNSPCIDTGDPTSPLDPDGTRADMGAHYFDQNAPQGTCTITLTPFGTPIVLPPSGGTVWFGVSIMNSPDYFNIYDGWYNLQLPDMQIIPMVLRQGLYLPAGGSLNRTLYLTVGQMSMPGIYTVTAYVGNHPDVIESFDSFTFEKLADGDQQGSGGEFTFFDGEVEHTFSLESAEQPKATELIGNYPNPFNPATTIHFSIVESEKVRLYVFNVNGERVATLINRALVPGNYAETFDGSGLSSGLYIYLLEAGNRHFTGKMILMK